MDDEQRFWLSLWGMFGLVILLLVGGIETSCTIQNRDDGHRIAEMVAKGEDPIRASCSLREVGIGSGDGATVAICATAAAHGGAK